MKNETAAKIGSLQEAFAHMQGAELKKLAEQLQLPTKTFNKGELIKRLMHYAVTEKVVEPLQIPAISRAQKNTQYPLHKDTLMLFGSYKNDLKTRIFFKALIGDHFHFTAQEIDWLREQWLKGNPPTYEAFTKEWQAEYERNKKEKREPKQEWAYIRFTQRYIKTKPCASKKEITNSWKIEQTKQKDFALEQFKDLIKD